MGKQKMGKRNLMSFFGSFNSSARFSSFENGFVNWFFKGGAESKVKDLWVSIESKLRLIFSSKDQMLILSVGKKLRNLDKFLNFIVEVQTGSCPVKSGSDHYNVKLLRGKLYGVFENGLGPLVCGDLLYKLEELDSFLDLVLKKLKRKKLKR